MKHFPIFLALKDRHCTVIGGGLVANRKIKALLKSGANITLISPQLCDELQQKVDDKRITYSARNFESSD